jgi:hypothetical protein
MTRSFTLGVFPLLALVALTSGPSAFAETDLPPLENVVDKERLLDQNWNWETRKKFWFTSQGSQVVPRDWFVALEEEKSTDLFARNDHMEALRFITLPRSKENPEGLPLGFVADQHGYLGFTCAACHTGQIDYQDETGKRHSWIVDGAPGLGNFGRFLEELVAALEATANTDAKLGRFASKLGKGPGDKQRLQKSLQAEAARLGARVAANGPHPSFGRIDAYGQVYNQVTGLDLGIPKNIEQPDAPASIPYLWNSHSADRVQWNGAAKNTEKKLGLLMGPLARNVVEILGVFGRLEFEEPSLNGYGSSIDLIGLGELEAALCSLHPPKWPAQLPKPDATLAEQGKALFAENCGGCHKPGVAEQEHEVTLVDSARIGTDPNLADNAKDRTGETGMLAGTPIGIISGDELGEEAKSYEILKNAVAGVILRDKLAAFQAMRTGDCGVHILVMPSPPEQEKLVEAELAKVVKDLEMPRAYIARPLSGIWATAPYLHNGSVPSLAELLEPPANRVKTFHVGERSFDPANVGYSTRQGSSTTELDTSTPGNSNRGHSKADALKPDQRKQLLEYLKTL